jgi:hypothetical protein
LRSEGPAVAFASGIGLNFADARVTFVGVAGRAVLSLDEEASAALTITEEAVGGCAVGARTRSASQGSQVPHAGPFLGVDLASSSIFDITANSGFSSGSRSCGDRRKSGLDVSGSSRRARSDGDAITSGRVPRALVKLSTAISSILPASTSICAEGVESIPLASYVSVTLALSHVQRAAVGTSDTLDSSAFSGFGSVNLAAISSSRAFALIGIVSDTLADAGSSHSITVVGFATNCRAIRGSSEGTGNAHLIVDEAAQASSISGSALSDREGFASGSLSGSGRSGRGSTGRCRSGGGNTSSSVGLPAASVHSERAAVFFVSESRAQVGTLLSTGSILSSPDALVLEGGANSLSSSLTAERKRSAFSDESVDTRRRLNVLAVSRGAVA